MLTIVGTWTLSGLHDDMSVGNFLGNWNYLEKSNSGLRKKLLIFYAGNQSQDGHKTVLFQ